MRSSTTEGRRFASCETGDTGTTMRDTVAVVMGSRYLKGGGCDGEQAPKERRGVGGKSTESMVVIVLVVVVVLAER